MVLVSNSSVGMGGSGICGAPAGCVGGIPIITSLSPSSIAGGSGDFLLTVNGSNFRVTSIISFNGTNLATTYVNSTELTATVTAALVASGGAVDVVVTNPTPGCGASSPESFTITTLLGGLRFFVAENFGPDPFVGSELPDSSVPVDAVQFRIQDAGSSDVYRLQDGDFGIIDAGSGIGGVTISNSRSIVRFSPDATKLAVLYTPQTNTPVDGDIFYRLKVYDLGTTLTAASTIDGPHSLYELDAPIIQDITSPDTTASGNPRWSDIRVNNSGDIYILITTTVADAVQETASWSLAATGPNESSIIVTADPRMSNPITTATVTFTKCATAGPCDSDLDVTITPAEAWWSSGSGTLNGAPTHDPIANFCPDAFISGIGFGEVFEPCADSYAEVSTTLSIDVTGLAENSYYDKTSDHPGTPLFDFGASASDGCYICCKLESTDPYGLGVRTHTGIVNSSSPVVVTNNPTSIKLIVSVPQIVTLAIWKKTVSGSLTEQVSRTMDGTVYNVGPSAIGGGDLEQSFRLLVPEDNIITAELQEIIPAHDRPFYVINLENEDQLLTVADRTLFSPDAEIKSVGTTTALQDAQTFVTYDNTLSGGAQIASRRSVVILHQNAEYRGYLFTNTQADLDQSSLTASPIDGAAPMVVMTDATNGYCVLGQYYGNGEIRNLTLDIENNTATAAAIPGDLIVSPGEANESRVRSTEILGDGGWFEYYIELFAVGMKGAS